MATTLSTNDLQDIAVRCTTDFVANGTSLNDSLAKEAAARDLNSEQVKRAVEATNVLCYLRTLEKSASDRTPEFPLADYDQVIAAASIPQSLRQETNPWDNVQTGELTKQAADNAFDLSFPDLSEQELNVYLYKEAQKNKRFLEDAVHEQEYLKRSLMQKAAELEEDPYGLEKLSEVAEGEDFTKLSMLVFGEVKEAYPSGLSYDLTPAQELKTLYKKACDLVAEVARRSELQKQAGIVSGIAGGIGKAIGATAKAVVGVPVKAVKGAASYTGRQINNAAADTGLGKAMLMKEKLPNPTTKRNLAIGAATVGAVTDASMYTPKHNPTTGEGGDVWKRLQNQ